MAATKSIMSGRWRDAYHYLSSVSVWNLIGGARDNVLALLKAKLQECGLKTYLFSYGSFYSSLSLSQLSEMFELPEMKVSSCNFWSVSCLHKAKGLLKAELQECGLKTYSLSYGSYYSSLSLSQLSEMFELAEMKVSTCGF